MSASQSAPQTLKEIVVIGAGVIGLTTALKIQEKGGYRVTIVAETLPTDPKSIRYTSHWAGAHHVSLAGDDQRQQAMDQETFKTMWDMSAPGGPAEGCFLRLPQVEYYREDIPKPEALKHMPDFKVLTKDELIPGAVGGGRFTTVTIDVPRYLNYLLSRFLASGGSIVRGAVQHIHQIIEGGPAVFSSRNSIPGPKVDAVVVCCGLGARSLGGVEDTKMFPIRGQTVLIHAPWIRFGRTMSSQDGTWTYVIPRRSGDVIVGGSKVEHDWYPSIRPEMTKDILHRVLVLCPELVEPEVLASLERAPTPEDLLPIIIEEGCGLRPARVGGIRLEVEVVRLNNGRIEVPVVYNYGHGGYGFQSSWGSASMALELLEGSF